MAVEPKPRLSRPHDACNGISRSRTSARKLVLKQTSQRLSSSKNPINRMPLSVPREERFARYGVMASRFRSLADIVAHAFAPTAIGRPEFVPVLGQMRPARELRELRQ